MVYDDPVIEKIEERGCLKEPLMIGYCECCGDPILGEDEVYCMEECYEYDGKLYCEDCFNEMLDRFKKEHQKTA